jgi:uncharacterized membrane protein
MATQGYSEATAPATHTAARRATLLLIATAGLSLVGLTDALYLTALHLSGATARCTVLTGCSEVLGSSYATIGGVPLALLGACAYFSVFSLSLLATFGYRFALTLLFPLVALMCVVSLGLVGLQAFVIGAFCEFCLISAAVTFTLFALVIFARRAARSA